MKGSDPDLEELFAPLAEKYAPTRDDRQRLARKLQASLAGTASPLTVADHCRHFLARRWPWFAASAFVVVAGGFAVAESSRSPSIPPGAPSSISSPQAASAKSPHEQPGTPAPASPPPEKGSPSPMPSLVVDVAALPPASAPKTPTPPDDALARETRLWREAHRALSAGELSESLRLLDEHERAFPKGVLAHERAVERVLVLCRMGRREDATREARAFLRAHGAGPLRARIESSCAADSLSEVTP